MWQPEAELKEAKKIKPPAILGSLRLESKNFCFLTNINKNSDIECSRDKNHIKWVIILMGQAAQLSDEGIK